MRRRTRKIVEFALTRKVPLLSFALACALVGFFIELTSEVHLQRDLEVRNFDRKALLLVSALRIPVMNGSAVDLTALGSFTLISILTILGLIILHFQGNRKGMLYLLCGSIGSGLLSSVLKNTLSRERPTEVEQLVEVASYSYPSGHTLAASSFYLLITFLSFTRFRSVRARLSLLSFSMLLIFAIGFSRIYLGVHYPSDVAGGLLIGSAWTFLLTAIFYGRS